MLLPAILPAMISDARDDHRRLLDGLELGVERALVEAGHRAAGVGEAARIVGGFAADAQAGLDLLGAVAVDVLGVLVERLAQVGVVVVDQRGALLVPAAGGAVDAARGADQRERGDAVGRVDGGAHGDRAAEREAGDRGACHVGVVEDLDQVGAELGERAVGLAEGRAAVAAQVVEHDAPGQHQRRDDAAPRAVVVAEAVDEHDGLAAADLVAGGGHRARSRRLFRSSFPVAPCGSASTRCRVSGHL